MKTRNFWIAVLAYLLPTFPLGYAWHLVTFHDAYAALQMYRADVIIPLGLASMIVQALVFAWAYPRLFDTRKECFLKSTVSATCVFFVFAWSYTTLPVAAKYNMTSVAQFMLLESAFTLVQFVIVTPLIALAWRNASITARAEPTSRGVANAA